MNILLNNTFKLYAVLGIMHEIAHKAKMALLGEKIENKEDFLEKYQIFQRRLIEFTEFCKYINLYNPPGFQEQFELTNDEWANKYIFSKSETVQDKLIKGIKYMDHVLPILITASYQIEMFQMEQAHQVEEDVNLN